MGMFPLMSIRRIVSLKELFTGGDIRAIITSLMCAVAFAATGFGLMVFYRKLDSKGRKSALTKMLVFCLMGLFFALTFAIPHAMIPSYQEWVNVGHVGGYVPTTICYFGWTVALVAIFALVTYYASYRTKRFRAIFLAALGLCTLVGLLFSNLGFTDANIIMVYLLGLLVVSMFTTHRAFSLVWAVTSVLLFDLLFTTPRFTFYAYGTGYPVTFVVMFAAAFIISTLAIRLKQNASQSAKAAQRMSVVLDTDRQLAKAKAPDEIFSVLAAQLSQLLKRSLVIYPSDGESLLNPNFYPTADDTVPYRADREKEAVDWAFRQHKRAGATTEAYPQTDYLYYSLRIQERVYGVVGVAVHGSPLDASEQSVLASVVGECSLALENARNAREKEESILLAENERLRANLLRAVSHDLRTPLTSIMGNADNLITSGETLDPATRAQVYHDIYNDAQWLTGMVENLLSASRMNEGKLNLNITTELMDDLIGEAVRHLGKRLDAFVFEWRKPDQLLFVRADARLIVQVILNLLDNAMKYTQPGSHIWIRTGKENGEVRVCVEDDGPGIPDDQKPHIFDLFYTSGNPAGDSRRGLGVGLALCQSILKAHDGRIWVTDRIPRGVCFEFALPEEEVTVHE